MSECFGEYFILDGVVRLSKTFDNSLIYEGESVYEVLKSISGLPVFFGDHMERLQKSVQASGRQMISDKGSLKLTVCENHEMINIKIVFNYRNGASHSLLYYLEPHYPTEDQYREGVKGILFGGERRDPESKVIDQKLRDEINRQLNIEKGYEALLVNSNKCITEGSRTNIFFIRDNRLFTAPDKSVLSGITRKHILGICKESGIPVSLECVRADEVDKYESVFMTGTSPVVLPFRSINGINFNVGHPFISILRELYQEKVKESLKSFARE
jgi:branched-chain amino acid aminotransferase